MRVKAILCLLFCISQFLLAHKPKENADLSKVAYDKDRSTTDQINPIYRWPLPQVSGNAHINIDIVVLGLKNSEGVPADALEYMQAFVSQMYANYGIYLNFKLIHNAQNIKSVDELKRIKNSQGAMQNNKLQIVVVPIYDLEITSSCVIALNEMATNNSVVGFGGNYQELAAFSAKSIGLMLGLLPTYYENSSMGVAAEDYNNCGSAGDFVCDTPFDYMGIKNDVKKKNCKYVGDFKSVDPTNIMSNSWSECMSYISPEQANKIKYNLIEIPSLNTVLGNESTLVIASKD